MNKKQIILLIITIIFLVLVFDKIDLETLVETVKKFEFKHLISIVLIFLASLYLRGLRWKFLLMNNPKYSAINLGEIFIVGCMLNILLPARAGDFYRAYYLGEEKGEKKLKVFGTIVLERIFDGMTMFFILLSAILLYSQAQWILNVTYGIGALFLTALLTVYLIFKYNKTKEISRFICSKIPSEKIQKTIKRITTYINIFIRGFSAFKKPSYLSIVIILSVIAWILEVTMDCIIINSFGLNLPMTAGLFVLSLTSFSTMIPSTSVLVGPYQAAYILALSLFEINKSQALAIAAVHQIILLLIFTIVGGTFMLKFNIQAAKKKQAMS